MSGGIAYVFDEDGAFRDSCNLETVTLETLEKQDSDDIKQMIERHASATKSERAWKLLALWDKVAYQFIKVMPKDYRRMLDAMQRAQQNGLTGEKAIMAAFEENARDVSRVGGG